MASGLFDFVQVREFDWEVDYTADEYLDLLNTFSNHLAMPWKRRDRLYTEIRRRILGRPSGAVGVGGERCSTSAAGETGQHALIEPRTHTRSRQRCDRYLVPIKDPRVRAVIVRSWATEALRRQIVAGCGYPSVGSASVALWLLVLHGVVG